MNNSTETVKIHFQLGNSSVLYEGPSEFLTQNLASTIEDISNVLIAKSNDLPISPNSPKPPHENANRNLKMTTGTISGRLSVKSGPDLVMAAAAKLSLADGRETFKRTEILVEMKTAPSYFKENYRKNLSGALNNLIKGDQLREVAAGVYAIEANTLEQLSLKLTD